MSIPALATANPVGFVHVHSSMHAEVLTETGDLDRVRALLQIVTASRTGS
jgi:hypothetical protein